MTFSTTAPTAADCVALVRSLQQLTRVRRRATRFAHDAAATAVLNAVGGDPSLRISMLAKILMIDVSAASRQVAALEAAGLVRRVRDEVDHRAQVVGLTAEGRQELERARERAGSEIAARLPAWSRPDVAVLTGLVNRLARDLSVDLPGAERVGSKRSFDDVSVATFESVNI